MTSKLHDGLDGRRYNKPRHRKPEECARDQPQEICILVQSREREQHIEEHRSEDESEDGASRNFRPMDAARERIK